MGDVSSVLTTPNVSSVDMSAIVSVEGGGVAPTAAVLGLAAAVGAGESPVRVRLSEAPRTPTPFKRALADVYQRQEPLSRTVRQINNNGITFP